MIVNHEKKTVFISVPKTGCTSIMVLLHEPAIHEKPEIYHMTVSEALALQPQWADYHFYGMVRNPYDRAVSTCFDVVLDKSHGKWAEELAKSQTFPQFVDKAMQDDNLGRLRHLWTQSRFFAAPHPVKTTVLKYEDYDNTACIICDAFGVSSAGLGRWRDTASRRQGYQHYLDPVTVKKLQTIYSQDFVAFNYALDPFASKMAG